MVVVEIRSGHIRRFSRLGIGAFVLLVAPRVVRRRPPRPDVTILVVSRTDSINFLAVDPLLDDLAVRIRAVTSKSAPCSGAWCSGQPVVPPVPAGARDWRVDSWAWNAWDSIVFEPSFSFFPADSRVPTPRRCAAAAFSTRPASHRPSKLDQRALRVGSLDPYRGLCRGRTDSTSAGAWLPSRADSNAVHLRRLERILIVAHVRSSRVIFALSISARPP